MRAWLSRARAYLADPHRQQDWLSSGIRVVLVAWAIHDPANLGRNIALACLVGLPAGGALLVVLTERRATRQPKG